MSNDAVFFDCSGAWQDFWWAGRSGALLYYNPAPSTGAIPDHRRLT